jgi:hypothetical protein
VNIVTFLDIVGVIFLVAGAFQANFRRVNSIGAGLALIGIGHLILPLV